MLRLLLLCLQIGFALSKTDFGMREGGISTMNDAAGKENVVQQKKTEGTNTYRITCAELESTKMVDPNSAFEKRYRRAFEEICEDEKANTGIFTPNNRKTRKEEEHKLQEGLRKKDGINKCELTYSNWAAAREALDSATDEPASEGSTDRQLFDLTIAKIVSKDHIIAWG